MIDDTPPPTSLRQQIEALEPGQSVLLTDAKLISAQSTVSRIKKDHSDRQYTTRGTNDGPRVWRLS